MSMSTFDDEIKPINDDKTIKKLLDCNPELEVNYYSNKEETRS
ncbi:hypothetical protein [Colwellia sp. E2M01]|nr:hypothetical protein [Colwellia sp. E2M01]